MWFTNTCACAKCVYICIVATITPANGIYKGYLKQVAEHSHGSGNKFVLSKTNTVTALKILRS